jgi:uncharacterized protein (TIGR02453 family)
MGRKGEADYPGQEAVGEAVIMSYPEAAVKFLRDLKKNNNREWFNDHKQAYEEQVKGPALEFAARINREFARTLPLYETDPKKALFRIYRDTRFSKNKEPYKTHVGVFFWHQGLTKEDSAGFYAGLDVDKFVVAAGSYTPPPNVILEVRQHIAGHGDELVKYLARKNVRELAGEVHGEELKRPPAGFSADHPHIDLLRKKAWHFYLELPVDIGTSPACVKEVWSRFKIMTPLVEFLNKPLLAAAKRADRTLKQSVSIGR